MHFITGRAKDIGTKKPCIAIQAMIGSKMVIADFYTWIDGLEFYQVSTGKLRKIMRPSEAQQLITIYKWHNEL